MLCKKTFYPLVLLLFLSLNIGQSQINLNFRFKTGVTLTHTRFDAQYDKIPQVVGHYNTVKFITEQVTGELFSFEEYLTILNPRKSFLRPTLFVEANMEFKSWPIYALGGCGNSQYDYNSFAWWYGIGIGPQVELGYTGTNYVVFNFEARRHMDSGFDEDAIIDSFNVDEKFKADMRSFFSAPNSLGLQKAWIGYASVGFQRKLKNKYSVTGGPFLAIDFTKDIERPAGVNMSCMGIKAVFSIDLGAVEAPGPFNYFNPFSR